MRGNLSALEIEIGMTPTKAKVEDLTSNTPPLKKSKLDEESCPVKIFVYDAAFEYLRDLHTSNETRDELFRADDVDNGSSAYRMYDGKDKHRDVLGRLLQTTGNSVS